MTRRILFITLAVLIVGTLSVYVMFARDMSRARARLVGRSKTVETSFGTVEYASIGEGEPMLVVHGAAGGFDQAIDMTGAIAARGYRLIAPSRFGYLRSSLPGARASCPRRLPASGNDHPRWRAGTRDFQF